MSAFVDAVAGVARTVLACMLNPMFSNRVIMLPTYEFRLFAVKNGSFVVLPPELTTVEAVFGRVLAIVLIVAGVRLVPPECVVVVLVMTAEAVELRRVALLMFDFDGGSVGVRRGLEVELN